jgi:hypothetical protein
MFYKNAIFILCGNARSFLDCIDSCYEHIITKLFKNTNTTITVLFYLKLNDPKHPYFDSFNYINRNCIDDKLNELKKYNIHIESIILNDNQMSDLEILSSVKDRSKYVEYFDKDENLIRALQCHYNFEACGQKILSYQKENNIEFDVFVYIRPDLFFTKDCEMIHKYSNTIVTLGIGSSNYAYDDHAAIIPKEYFYTFFFDRMITYLTNTTNNYRYAEDVYLKTIEYEKKELGHFEIKRY